MKKEDLKKRLGIGREAIRSSPKPIEYSNSPIKFRIAYLNNFDGLVPVLVNNQGFPVFCSGNVYLDTSHFTSVSLVESSVSVSGRVKVVFNIDGVQRVDALSKDTTDPMLVMFVHDVPYVVIHRVIGARHAAFELDCFYSKDDAKAFVEIANAAMG